jgi:hypothetical protein
MLLLSFTAAVVCVASLVAWLLARERAQVVAGAATNAKASRGPQEHSPRSPNLAARLGDLFAALFFTSLLIGISFPAVWLLRAVFAKGPRVGEWPPGPTGQTCREIRDMQGAIDNFKTWMGPKYIPSRIKLCEKFGSYGKTPLDVDSINYLTSLFPHLLDPVPETGIVLWRDRGIDWNGDGRIDDDGIILEGHQCLVFFLGGIPKGGGIGNRWGEPDCMGFSTDPRDPAKIDQTSGRKGPFYEFPSGRLVDLTGHGFYSFADPYGHNKPYVYFSNYGIRNGYAHYTDAQNRILDNLSLGVQPYYDAPGEYYCAVSFQIISAGADGVFGPGGWWSAAQPGNIAPAGRDDQTNFSAGNRLNAEE